MNGARKRESTCKRERLDYYLTPLTTMNLKYIKYLHMGQGGCSVGKVLKDLSVIPNIHESRHGDKCL